MLIQNLLNVSYIFSNCLVLNEELGLRIRMQPHPLIIWHGSLAGIFALKFLGVVQALGIRSWNAWVLHQIGPLSTFNNLFGICMTRILRLSVLAAAPSHRWRTSGRARVRIRNVAEATFSSSLIINIHQTLLLINPSILQHPKIRLIWPYSFVVAMCQGGGVAGLGFEKLVIACLEVANGWCLAVFCTVVFAWAGLVDLLEVGVTRQLLRDIMICTTLKLIVTYLLHG